MENENNVIQLPNRDVVFYGLLTHEGLIDGVYSDEYYAKMWYVPKYHKCVAKLQVTKFIVPTKE